MINRRLRNQNVSSKSDIEKSMISDYISSICMNHDLLVKNLKNISDDMYEKYEEGFNKCKSDI